MSSRSAARGRAAASSIRLTSRTSKAVATRRAKPSRCFLFCRGKRAAKSAPIAAAIVSIPHPHPPAAPNPQLAPQLHGRASALGNLMGGEHRDLETLLQGFNRAYNARRQRVLKG